MLNSLKFRNQCHIEEIDHGKDNEISMNDSTPTPLEKECFPSYKKVKVRPSCANYYEM